MEEQPKLDIHDDAASAAKNCEMGELPQENAGNKEENYFTDIENDSNVTK